MRELAYRIETLRKTMAFTVERPARVAIAGELAGEKVNTLSLAGPITASLNSVRSDWLERVQSAGEELVPVDAEDPLIEGVPRGFRPFFVFVAVHVRVHVCDS